NEDRASRPVTISIVQINARDDDKEGNIRKVLKGLEVAGERKSDIVVLPETFTGSGLALHNAQALAEPISGPTIKRLAELAEKHKMYIVGSLFEAGSDGKTYNTAPLIGRDGKIAAVYRKTHLFDPQSRPDIPAYHESEKITAGDSLCLVDLDFGRIGIAICSDIRFPELFLDYALQGAEMVVLPTAFPARLDHWEFLNRARATDNQYYLASSGMVGHLADSTVNFVGRSMIVDPWGVVVGQAPDREDVLTVTIDLRSIEAVRNWWPLNAQRRPALYGALNQVTQK
ncbi:MAG TPA: hypothetical protein DD390_01930, partial [Rhodospirillaceae bacterium]|nr:hypothetical protein [Rhodospirillaceae bacterium]